MSHRFLSRLAAAVLMLLGFGLALGAGRAYAEWEQRRKDQFPTEPGYLIVPAPYSLPGIGQGIFVVGFFSNVFRSPTDVYAYWITGDAEGYGGGVSEAHLIERTLLLDVWREQINRAQVFQYPSRGMDTSGDDYQLVDVADVREWGGTLILTFSDRHFELFYDYFTQGVDIEAFRDKDGHIVRDLEEPIHSSEKEHVVGMVVDDTDDRWDPRQGLRGVLQAALSPRQEDDAPDFIVVTANAQWYVPLGRQSTWVFDLFHSQAVVRDDGETDPAVLVREVCNEQDPAAQAYCEQSPEAQDYVRNARAANRNGTAESLGGRDRLRGYPDNRFEGAYTQYAGTELRINFTEEMTPFDYFFWKDVRTNLQLALIAETGTVAETSGGLWKRNRSDYGLGFRMITAGGGVYRADYVTGDEGPQLTVIVNYPW